MTYFVYILESQQDGSFYIGYTSDLTKRIVYHNSGRSTYTRKKQPWKLIYFEKFTEKRDAIIRERQIKSWKSKQAVLKLIKQNSGPVV